MTSVARREMSCYSATSKRWQWRVRNTSVRFLQGLTCLVQNLLKFFRLLSVVFGGVFDKVLRGLVLRSRPG